MRGIILAGGSGTRLNPITLGVSKPLIRLDNPGGCGTDQAELKDVMAVVEDSLRGHWS